MLHLLGMNKQIVADGAITAIDMLCTARHVSHSDLARLLNISRSAMSLKMSGRNVFTLSQIHRIADYFDVSVDALLGREPLEVS